MKNSSNCYNVKLRKNLMNLKERLFNDFISLLQSLNVNFTHVCRNIKESLGSDPLW